MATYTSNYGWTKPSGSDNVDISVLNNNLDDQDSTIHDAFLNMAPPFSESSTYAVDDIVLYGTGLYKCHTAVVTPSSWTGSTNWQVYKLSEGGSGGGGSSQKAYGTAVNILTATQQSPFTCPADGVVNLQSNYASNCYVVLHKIGWRGFMGIAKGNESQANGAMTVPVLKGDQLYVATGGTDPVANYYPYVDAE